MVYKRRAKHSLPHVSLTNSSHADLRKFLSPHIAHSHRVDGFLSAVVFFSLLSWYDPITYTLLQLGLNHRSSYGISSQVIGIYRVRSRRCAAIDHIYLLTTNHYYCAGRWQGLKPNNPRWENQDNYVMKEDLGGLGIRLFVVLDGHGEVCCSSCRCSAG